MPCFPRSEKAPAKVLLRANEIVPVLHTLSIKGPSSRTKIYTPEIPARLAITTLSNPPFPDPLQEIIVMVQHMLITLLQEVLHRHLE